MCMAAKNGARNRETMRLLMLASLAAACSSDCVYNPCPLPNAAEISVTASNAPAGIPGLTAAITGALMTTLTCSPTASDTLCRIPGGPGVYHAKLSAPGYQTVDVTFTVTGTSAGCNTCGHVDLQRLSVAMQPATGS